jgi:hypothetical protein
MNALRSAARGVGWSAWANIGITLGLGAVYLVLGALCLRYFEVAARKNATLSLT